MEIEKPPACDCDSEPQNNLPFVTLMDKMPAVGDLKSDEPCCGPPAEPPSGPDERPGYSLNRFVDGFMQTAAGKVPVVKTGLERQDILGTVLTRTGIGRNNYKVAPGLYAIGNPDENAPVIVTANYKLSFDHVRRELTHQNVWLLILDTRGVNVWCAAGKGTFATGELAKRIIESGLDKVVKHRRVIVPQLGATGVSSKKVKKLSGFRVIWGPVRASDIVKFLENGMQTDRKMRLVTFSLVERLVLVPVEISLVVKPALWVLLALFLLSGIGPGIFSFSGALDRGQWAVLTILLGILAGAGVAPLLLPWIPGTAFAAKGIITGLALALPVAIAAGLSSGLAAFLALLFLSAALSSYLAMNFTGTTPFTSPSGVEKEMRRFIPIQIGMALGGVVLWIGSAF
jgi:hypothetical protein